HRTAASREYVDRVLYHGFQCPLQQHGVSTHDERMLGTVERDLHCVRERRYTLAEVLADAAGKRTHVHVVRSRRVTYSLEAVGHSLQPLQVAVHMRYRRGRERITGVFGHELEPAA